MNETSGTPDLARAKRIFGELLEQDRGRRDAALARLAAEDPALADAVRSLLEADARASGLLDGSAAPADVSPRVIGPYKLLQLIGEGGFGTVWMAEQTAPMRRRVAIKLLKPGMDSRQVIARFEAERQALALMEHASIARVFDAGTSEDGRPYFVMELVNGVPITQYCDENRLNLRQRLELFIPVCQAVHHAHQKGVIHRDLKPGNVLVTLHDGVPVPKVIDFGIAKALDRPLTDKTLFTEFRTMIGTPEYMSPEQAEISGLDIDTRSDVYSLGVLLYELLVGVTPFDAAELRSKAFGEMQRIIREVDPPAPSVRLSTVATAMALAEQRASEPRRLSGLLRGELDWIIMRCLEKDRRRRYDGARELASDIENHLRGDAVLARPVSRLYRLRKFARRNRALVFSTAAVLLALSIGLVVALLAWREARQQQQRAETREREATRQARRAEFISRFLEHTIGFADPYSGSGDPRISQVFQQAVEDLDAGRLSPQPQDEAALRTVIGRVATRIDQAELSVRQLEKARAFLQAQQPPDVTELARVTQLLGGAKARLAQYADARAIYEQSAALARSVNDIALLDEVRFNLTTLLLSERRYDEAVPALEALLADARASSAERDVLALRLESLAMAESHLGRHDAAIAHAREALALRRSATTDRSFATQMAVVDSLAVLTQALGMSGQHADAARELESMIAELEAQPTPRLGAITMLRESLAARYNRLGKRPEAAELLRQVVEARAQIDGPTHPRLAHALGNYGLALHRLGRTADARQQWQRAWLIVKDRTDLPRGGKADIASLLATVSTPTDTPSNLELFEVALTSYRAVPKPGVIFPNTLMNYWNELHTLARHEDALRIAEELATVAPRVYPAAAAELSQAELVLARSLLSVGRDFDRAERSARSALADRERRAPQPDLQVHHARSVLGEALLRQGKRDEARALIEPSTAALLDDPKTPALIRAEAQRRLDDLRAASTP